MTLILTDPAVQAAMIGALGSILAAVIASIAAALVGKRFADQKRLQDKIRDMQGDLFFLLAVEEEHCRQHGQKILVRDAVRANGHAWTGKFTPGRVQYRLANRGHQ